MEYLQYSQDTEEWFYLFKRLVFMSSLKGYTQKK